MNFDPQNLRRLRQQTKDFYNLQNEAEELRKKSETMESLLPQLAAEAEEKENYADRLEQGGISGLFYSALGRRAEKQAQARKEAQSAFIKYQDAERTLEELRQQRMVTSQRLEELEDCPSRYEKILAQKRQKMLSENWPQAQQLQILSRRAEEGQALLGELRTALEEGERIRGLMEELEELLRSASNWGMVDVIGGNFLSDMVKYDKLDQVRQLMNALQGSLSRYSGYMQGMSVDLGADLGVGSGLQFADFFLDNVFVDSFVLSRIQQIRSQLSGAKRQLLAHLEILRKRQSSMENELSRLRTEAEELIVSATVM